MKSHEQLASTIGKWQGIFLSLIFSIIW